MQSNALVKSQKIPPTHFLWSRSVILLFKREKTASLMWTSFQNPNCTEVKILFDSKYCTNLLNMIVSKIFEIDVRSDIGL